jgi:hypothetical protein
MDEMTITEIDLATVAKTVAETDRRRVLVREKLDQAQSVVEALDAESKSLQESVLELKRDLEETTRAKDHETAELGKTIEQRRRAIEELKSLAAAADELRIVSEQKSTGIGANLDVARAELASLESNVSKSSADARALDEMVNRLRNTVAESRRQADAVEAQLASVGATTRSAVSAAIDIQNRIDSARGALDMASARKRETDEACEALGAITDALRSKTVETVGAVNAIDDLMAEHQRQSSTLATRLAAVAKLVGEPEHQNGSTAPAPSTNGSHASEPISRFSDPLRTIALLALERLITKEEADRIASALRAEDGERALREAWALTSGAVMPSAHRLVFGEVLRTMGDVKAAIIYYEQAASAKNAAPVIRYLASLAYLNMDLLDRSAYVAQLLSRDRGGKLLGRILESLRMEQTGNADAAARSLSEAASLRGFPKWEYDEAYFQLGGMYERKNNIDAAVSAYEKVSPSAPYADIVERVRALF